MSENLGFAVKLLLDNAYTLVLYDGKEQITSQERGVKPLLQLYEKRKDLSEFSAADKVIGKAAAFMYVLLGIKEIYTDVVSRPATEVFKKYGIDITYNTLCDYIINRTKTDMCPMEKTVLDMTNPQEAYKAILEKLKELQQEKRLRCPARGGSAEQ